MSQSLKDVLKRYDMAKEHVGTGVADSRDSQIVTAGMLVLASVLRDCTFESDTECVAESLDTGLNLIAEHCSMQIGEIANQLRLGLDSLGSSVECSSGN